MTLDHAIKVRILASQPTPSLSYSLIILRRAMRSDPLIVFRPNPLSCGAFSPFGHATDTGCQTQRGLEIGRA